MPVYTVIGLRLIEEEGTHRGRGGTPQACEGSHKVKGHNGLISSLTRDEPALEEGHQWSRGSKMPKAGSQDGSENLANDREKLDGAPGFREAEIASLGEEDDVAKGVTSREGS